MTLRVFAPPHGAWATGQRIELPTEESHYLLRVRRARVGAVVELLDGEAARWEAVLVAVEGREAVLELRGPLPTVIVMPLLLVLVVPEPRAVLEAITHACELAATEVVLVEGEHSPGGLPSADRIARTVRAAQRQCGRACPPRVWVAASLEDALQATAPRPGWVARLPAPAPNPATNPDGSPSDTSVELEPIQVDPDTGARLVVGPEGGLSAREEAVADGAGLRPLALGPWVLRTPTAVSAGLARLLAGASRRPWYAAP